VHKYLAFFCLALGLYPATGYADPSSVDQVLAQLSSVPGGGSESEVQSAPVVPVIATPVPAAPVPIVPFKPSGYGEAGGNYNSVSHNYGNWLGEYLKGEVQTDPSNRWNAEILNQREFRSTGVYGNIGNTHIFNEDWFGSVTAGAGDGGLYLPRYRFDAFINKKWLEDRQLITTLGVGMDKAMDPHRDASVFLGATYYFKTPWIIQGGIRLNNSNPGNINSTSQFIAVTQGENKKHFITLRYGFGHEAYQVIGPGQVLSDFPSQQVSLELRQWVGSDWGFNLSGERYHNPNYDRTGINIGLFIEF